MVQIKMSLIIFEKINEDKVNIKIKIQNIFTKLRNTINNREDELLLEVDKYYNKLFFSEDIIKNGEKLPNKTKESLERGKIINKEWNNNKLNTLINVCLNIEYYIEEINFINGNINKCKSKNIKIKFKPEENEIDNYLEKIKILEIYILIFIHLKNVHQI